jgi:hypothetical protein
MECLLLVLKKVVAPTLLRVEMLRCFLRVMRLLMVIGITTLESLVL